MVESGSKLKGLLLFSKNRPTSADDAAQISPPTISHAEALRLPPDFVRAFPNVLPTSIGSSEPTPTTGLNESLSMSPPRAVLTPHEAVLRSRLEKVLTTGRGGSMEKDIKLRRGRRETNPEVFVEGRRLMAQVSQGQESLSGEVDGGRQPTPLPSPSEPAALSSHSKTLSRQSSVHFVTGVVIRKKTSVGAFSCRSSSVMMSASPTDSFQYSNRFSASVRRRNSNANDDDLEFQNVVEGNILRPRPRPPSERSYSQQPKSALPWSVHRLQLPPPLGLGITSVNFPSPSPFPRHDYAIHATATQSGEFFLFGGLVHDKPHKDLYRFSTRDRSATLLQTAGDIPSSRSGQASALVNNMLVVWGGNTKRNKNVRHAEGYDNRLYMLNLGSRHWTRADVQGQSPMGRYGHTITLVGSKLFVFGGQIDGLYLNDLIAFDFDPIGSTPSWHLFEPSLGSEIPDARAGHVSVSYGDKLIIFGGIGGKSCYNDTWSFDTSSHRWSRLKCTGFAPIPREGHAAALVGDVIYVCGGRGIDKCGLTSLSALVMSSQQWHSFEGVGPEPSGRLAMVSVGPKIFVLGGETSTLSNTEDHEIIHILDTTYLRYVSSGPSTPVSLVNLETPTTELHGDTFSQMEAPGLEPRPYHCPKPDCNNSFNQANELKYHLTHGACNIVAPKDLEHALSASQRQGAEATVPDPDNSETGSHSSSDEIEIPWFDSHNPGSIISWHLNKKLPTDSDGSWCSEQDIDEMEDEQTHEVTWPGEAELEAHQEQSDKLLTFRIRSDSNPELSSPGVVIFQNPPLIMPHEFQQSSNSGSRSLPSPAQIQHLSKIISPRDVLSDLMMKATDDIFLARLDEVPPKMYKNLVARLGKKILDLWKGTNYLDILQGHVEQMNANSTIMNLVESSKYRTQLMALSSTLGCHDDNEIHNALDEDEADIVHMLQFVLSSDSDRKAVLRLRGNDAERFLTLTHNVIDKQGFPFDDDGQRYRHSAHRLLVKLSENCGILPSFLSIIGINNCGKEPVAGGGFADIFRASYRGEDVALKRLRDFQVHQQREAIHRRFCREAVLWQDLRHPNVLPFYGIDLETFLPRLTMVSPWMQHGTILKHITDIGGPLIANVDRYLFEIAQGLHYLHSRNIVHGDLRGTNIFIDDQWHVRLADFGLAGFADATLVTHTSNNAGSIRWMAPELHNPEIFDLKGLRRTAASDMYALACVALEIYTGNYPFSDIPRDGTVILKVMQGQRPIRPTVGVGRTIPDDLWCLIKLCWQQAPSDRPQILAVVEKLKDMSIET